MGCLRRRGMISRNFLFLGRFSAFCVLLVLVSFVSLFVLFRPTKADDNLGRHFDEEVVVMVRHWQLARWQDGGTVCDFQLQHQAWPSWNDVSQGCGPEVAKAWQSTPPCQDAFYGGTGAKCTGLVLRQLGQSAYSYTRRVELPEITLRVVATNCTPGEECSTRPEIQVLAKEPLGDYQITRVHVRVGDRERIYDGFDAILRLPLTNDQGATLIYWAESSFGDESQRHTVKFRAVREDGTESSYRFDLLNDDWESTLPGGSVLWDIFPPSDGSLPQLFEQPPSAVYLATANRYAYLAGHLIRTGKVDVSECRDSGLSLDGAATVCGEKVSAPKVVEWQNQYDEQIFASALDYHIPAHVLKAVIAQESQFWPVSNDPYELGLGYVTENGVDMLMLWNINYYLSLCVPAYGNNSCSAGYSNLQADRQTIIRRIAFDKIGTQAEIDLLAAMLYASAAQTKQMVVNVAHTEPAGVSTYEDMWKISVANYYSGSGCIGTALRASLDESKPFTWTNVSGYLLGDCQIAKDYVQRVLGYAE